MKLVLQGERKTEKIFELIWCYMQCVKSVLQMPRFFWSVFSCIRAEYRKYGPEKAPYLDTFHAVMGTNFRSNPFFKLLKDYLIFYNKETGVRSLADDITDDILMFMKLYRDDSGTIY